MGFASAYLADRAIFPYFIKEPPDPETGLIIVIPAYNEPGITRVIDSLAGCHKPGCGTEVIVVVNAPTDAPSGSLEINRQTISDIDQWKSSHSGGCFNLFTIDVPLFRIPGWGVGAARKTGMDEAVRRFNALDRPDGVIVSLDADCVVEANYLTALCNDLYKRGKCSACSIYFEHPLSGDEFSEDYYKAIALYELHLRYYNQGLVYAGFPFAYHTIGSAMAVKAEKYVKAGGMNRRQAGEDFYFIQKLVPAGGYFNLNSTTVHPSPRSSYRVPFGTGATIKKMAGGMSGFLLSYNIRAFRDLKSFFTIAGKLSEEGKYDPEEFYDEVPASIRLFKTRSEWVGKIVEIRSNTSGSGSFMKRFYGWFNMFMIVKFMNMAHREMLEKTDIIKSARELLLLTGDGFSSKDPVELLDHYRKLEKMA
jgi:glycosyltransferase involved in cell wall biosynthesis